MNRKELKKTQKKYKGSIKSEVIDELGSMGFVNEAKVMNHIEEENKLLKKELKDLKKLIPSKLRVWIQRFIMLTYAGYLIYDNQPEEGFRILLGA